MSTLNIKSYLLSRQIKIFLFKLYLFNLYIEYLKEQKKYLGDINNYSHNAIETRSEKSSGKNIENSYNYHTNGIGSITAIINSNGEIIERYSYGLYGLPVIVWALRITCY